MTIHGKPGVMSMLPSQLFKILFLAAFIYLAYNLVMFIMRLGRNARVSGREQNRAGGRPRGEGSFGPRAGKQDIELDKDQYKVE